MELHDTTLVYDSKRSQLVPSIDGNDVEELFKSFNSGFKKLEESVEKINSLRQLFTVERTGDDLDAHYKVVFNSGGGQKISENQELDRISNDIMTDFIRNYSLDMSILYMKLRDTKNLIESKLARGKPNYCEVDLLGMTDKKEPVEC